MGAKLAPYMANDEQVEADLAYMNGVLEAAYAALEAKGAARATGPVAGSGPTKGLRLHTIAMEDDKVVISSTAYNGEEQAERDTTYINWLIETDEKRREHLAKQQAGGQDILIDLGDMTTSDLDIALDTEYESMTEDFIQTFNNVVLQGIEPIKGVFSMSQAFAIVLGYALRANMPFQLARDMLTQVMKSATASEKMVRVITKQ